MEQNNSNENQNEKSNENFDEFKKRMTDFLKNILTTFPEYKERLRKNEIDFLTNPNETNTQCLFDYCKEIYPKHFFDFLYKREEIFTDKDANTFLIPNIDFKEIWRENISQNTREAIWNHLKMILFSIVGNLDDNSCFGDTANLFEAIDGEKLTEIMMEAINEMGKSSSGNEESEWMNEEENNEDKKNSDKTGGGEKNEMGDEAQKQAEEMKKHLDELLDGKIGRLAKEIFEEAESLLDIDFDNSGNAEEMFKQFMKNPSKLINIAKKIGSKLSTKLEEKLKSGELKESELMSEASELMEKMKSMPGMKNIEKMIGKMGGVGNNKMNMGAMQSNLRRNMKQATQKERMLKKLEIRRAEAVKAAMSIQNKTIPKSNEKEYIHTTFKLNDEPMEKTSRNKKKRRKKKKKKRK